MPETITLRCSALPLAAACPASTLPTDVRLAGGGPEGDLGTALHHLMAFAVRGTFLEASDVARRVGVDVDELEFLARRAWSCWEQIRHSFPEPQTEVYGEVHNMLGLSLTGHIDVLSVLHPVEPDGMGEVRVLDWKTGHDDADHDEQLKGYCYLAIANELPGALRAYAAVVRVREQTIDGRWYDRMELEDWWVDRLHRLLGERQNYAPGRHCTYCPRAAACPAKTQLLRQAVAGFSDTVTGIWETLPDDPAQRGLVLTRLLDRVKLVEAAAAVARNLLRADVAAHGGSLPSGDGRELVLTHQEQQRYAPQAALPLLRDYLDPDELFAATSVSKTKVEAALRAKLPRGEKQRAIRDLNRRLEAAGAMHSEFIERLEVRRTTPPIGDTKP